MNFRSPMPTTNLPPVSPDQSAPGGQVMPGQFAPGQARSLGELGRMYGGGSMGQPSMAGYRPMYGLLAMRSQLGGFRGMGPGGPHGGGQFVGGPTPASPGGPFAGGPAPASPFTNWPTQGTPYG